MKFLLSNRFTILLISLIAFILIVPDLLTEFDGAIVYGTFNRPHARNALSNDMRAEMFEFLKQVEGVTAYAEKRKPGFKGK